MCSSPMGAENTSRSLDIVAVKRAIADLPRADRALLQSWILARFDVRGYPQSGTEGLDAEEARRDPDL